MKRQKNSNYNSYNQDSFVAFIDILGFSNLIKNIKSEETFNRILKILTAAKNEEKFDSFKNKETLKNFSLKILSISDSIIITVPHSPERLYLLIRYLLFVQRSLLILNITVRGFVAKGKVYNKKGILFGEGYLKAYEGEKGLSKKGCPAQIVFDEDIMIQRHFIKFCESKLLKRGDCGYFLDYASSFKKNDDDSSYLKVLTFINEQIKVYSSDEKILSKYQWLKSYFENNNNL